MRILVVWPDNFDRASFAAVEGHEFVFAGNGPGHWAPDAAFDPVGYAQGCLDLARRASVEAVVSTHDLGDLVAAWVARELGLPGPDPDAVFTCLHKYYSRRKEMDPIRSEPIPLTGGRSSAPPFGFPVFVKPPWLKLGLLGFQASDEHEFDVALGVARREYPRWSRQYYPLFDLAVGTGRYPLATTDMMLAEEVVDAPQVTVEGWVQHGEIHVWAITDTNTYPGTRVIDGFSTPSRQPRHAQEEIVAFTSATARRYGLDDTFFNIELWLTDSGIRLTEVNGRGAVCFAGIYGPALGASIFAAVADVACGLAPRSRPRPTGRVAGQFNLVTFSSGFAGELVDFVAAAGIPALRMFRSADDYVEPVSEFGVVLGQLELAGSSYEEIHAHAEAVRRHVGAAPVDRVR